MVALAFHGSELLKVPEIVAFLFFVSALAVPVCVVVSPFRWALGSSFDDRTAGAPPAFLRRPPEADR